MSWGIVRDGGQVVLLPSLDRGRAPPRISQDLDSWLEVRSNPGGIAATVAVLTDLGSSRIRRGRLELLEAATSTSASGP